MLKVWQFSSAVTLLQLISVFMFCDLTLKDPLSILDVLGNVSIIITIIAFVVGIPMKNEMLIIKAKLFIFITLISGFCSVLIIEYLKYSKHKYNGPQLGTLLIDLFILSIMIIYVFDIVKLTKKIDLKANAFLIILCAFPLGIGMIFGGIAGKLAKKF